ncbi:hypothetical protein [Larkinella punicea]|uniref:hypothetical protein n=1 Tax=Larkinella punicea TaxID=2315727 RepID=UPI0010589600|nr:hypothetical protein [Larkinella punicea]
MSLLQPMPALHVSPAALLPFGQAWQDNGGKLTRSPPNSSSALCEVFDQEVGRALAVMLGNIAVVVPNKNALTPSHPNCVEVGPVRVVGGVRPQNFDVGYRPDGIRFAFDSKSLNDTKSVKKNWQNMINDLATEATTVHTRFPHAIVGFMVIIPEVCITEPRLSAVIQTLERLSRRLDFNEPSHRAESISLVLWNPVTSIINPTLPDPLSPLRIESFSAQVEAVYINRYKGLPPHVGE